MWRYQPPWPTGARIGRHEHVGALFHQFRRCKDGRQQAGLGVHLENLEEGIELDGLAAFQEYFINHVRAGRGRNQTRRVADRYVYDPGGHIPAHARQVANGHLHQGMPQVCREVRRHRNGHFAFAQCRHFVTNQCRHFVTTQCRRFVTNQCRHFVTTQCRRCVTNQCRRCVTNQCRRCVTTQCRRFGHARCRPGGTRTQPDDAHSLRSVSDRPGRSQVEGMPRVSPRPGGRSRAG